MVRAETISGMNGEFQRLGDVVVVNDGDVDWVVRIVADETVNVQGRVTGVAYSTAILRPLNKNLLNFYLSNLSVKEDIKKKEKQNTQPTTVSKNKLTKEQQAFAAKIAQDRKMLDKWNEDNRDAIEIIREHLGPKSQIAAMTRNHFQIDNLRLDTGSREDIQSICRAIVASIDVNQLEGQRKQRAAPWPSSNDLLTIPPGKKK
jgi:hypothetical protein